MKKHKIICACCGKEFISGSHNAKWCSDCKSEVRRQRSQELRQYSRLRYQNEKAQKNNRSLTEFLREIDADNKAHGTSLTYGQYTAMLRNGGAVG